MDGLQRLTEFLAILKAKKITYRLDHFSDDGVNVTLSLAGKRVEVDFFPDHLEFECFTSDGGVHTSEDALMKLIAENWD